jgi:hypothetical protein
MENSLQYRRAISGRPRKLFRASAMIETKTKKLISLEV